MGPPAPRRPQPHSLPHSPCAWPRQRCRMRTVFAIMCCGQCTKVTLLPPSTILLPAGKTSSPAASAEAAPCPPHPSPPPPSGTADAEWMLWAKQCPQRVGRGEQPPTAAHHLLKVDEVLSQRAVAFVDEGHVCSRKGCGGIRVSAGFGFSVPCVHRAVGRTFKEEGDEGDDGGAQLGDGQTINPVVP